MKKIGKNIGKIILFAVILIVLVETTTYFLIRGDSAKKYGILDAAKYEILEEDENTIDTVYIGDSLVYSGISPMEIWNEYGFTVFDCSNAAQLTRDSYAQLQAAIKSQHPKIVFFEADVLFRDERNRPWYYPVQRAFEESFPITKRHDNWKKILFSFANNDEKFKWINVEKGYYYSTKVRPGYKKDYMAYSKNVKPIPETNLKYFEKMLKLCEENNIKFVLVTMPTLKWYYSKHAGVSKLAEEKNIEYIDLNINNPLNIDWSRDTRDKGEHLNYYGAKKVSHFIGEYLKESNLVKSHKNEKKYQSWEECYQQYQKH